MAAEQVVDLDRALRSPGWPTVRPSVGPVYGAVGNSNDLGPIPVPTLLVDRLADSYRFLTGGKALVVKLGGFRHQDFWLLDLSTGERRQLTRLRPGESIHRFDVSLDGRQIVFERVRENSDVVLIEVPQ